MCLSKSGIGLITIFFAFITAGCGELDTILSSKLSTNPVYRVNAAVEGRSLDECAIVSVGSRIRPHFLDSIEGDPDITGLVVFLKTLEGETVSRKLRYVPGSPERSSEQGVGTDTAVGDQILEDDAPETSFGQTVSGEDTAGKTEAGTDAKSGEDWKDGTSPANDGYSADGNSFREEEDAAADQSSDLNDSTEKEVVYQIREKKTFSGTGETSDPDELVVYVSKLSAELPALLFPEKLMIGPYILVFQVLGLEGVLSYFEKFIYYIGDAELALGDIQTYHSGNAGRSGVVSPDSVLMLETKVIADERLAPYIVWYHGKKRLREGPVSDGVDRFLWQAPAQTGFQAIRAEVFPFAPPDAYKNSSGLVKELSLAISSKQARKAVVNTEASPPDSVTRWYQFSADLSDSLAPQDGGRELKPRDNTVITWFPKTGIYGLAAGSGYSYTIHGPFFTPDKELPGRGQFVFRFAVQSSGIISSGIFTMDRTSQTLKLDLSCDTDTNRLILSCALGDEKQEQKLSLPFYIRDEWITAVVDFTVGKNEFRAELNLLPIGNGEFQDVLASLSDKSAPAGRGIVLPGALTGEGVLRIGTTANFSTAAAVKSGANDTAAQIAGNTLTSLITGEENRNAPVLADTETGKISGTATPAPALLLDAIAVLFRVIDPDTIAAGEPADETGEGEAELASEDAVPPKDVSPNQPEEQVKIPAEKDLSASGTGQNRQSLPPAKSGTNTDRDSTGKETDLTRKTRDGDQTPDDTDTYETGEFPAKEPVPNTEPRKG
jgi:hypothetical protein